ncbi:MAG: 4'-phosphopantetheinyl transferase superfamily protein [Wenzhouxiangellaceae bacterium]|nr:4'-phosphopantetheinyl transferase superfamily protein [Wenzhouxiangellaceae bacterium]
MDMIESRSLPLNAVPALALHALHLWWLDLDGLGWPPGLERRGERGPKLHQQFLLRLLLGAYLKRPGRDVRLVRDAAGKPNLAPELTGSGIRFNLSHAGRCMVVAVGRRIDPGVDIESSARRLDAKRLATRWFPADEAELIGQLSGEAARLEFLRRWTVREALVKAMGSGIAASVGAIGLAGEDACAIERLPPHWPSPRCWQVVPLAHPDGWIGHLACAQPFRKLKQFALTGSAQPPQPAFDPA